ncbi:MAG: DNA methyltransferase [Patescibacteria group bacterium]
MLYLFELGHQPQISLEEIFSVLERKNIKYELLEQKQKQAFFEIDFIIDATEIMRDLGGTVKISQFLGSNSQKEIVEFLKNKKRESKIVFSISAEDKKYAQRLGIEMKKNLKKEGISARYVEIKNSASVIHNDILDKGGDFFIDKKGVFVTLAIQDIEEFSRRDFDRPQSDSVSGMLPPKLARIMINLAGQEKEKVLLDPFCGSGTVLTEAIDLGFEKIIGSDLSAKAVTDTEKNITWLINTSRKKNEKISVKIFKSDVRELSQKISLKSIDFIVFEPFMGKPIRGREDEKMILKQIMELRNLFVDAFTEFKKILKKDGIILGIIPRFNIQGKILEIDCKKEIEKIGFENVGFKKQKTLVYARPGQVVEREIFKFKN